MALVVRTAPMSDLPSPDSFKRSGVTLDDVKPIIRAYVMGRLVDREAIDYEAATDQLGLIDWIAMQTKHPSSVEMPPYEWLKAEATAVVDAAIGDTDE